MSERDRALRTLFQVIVSGGFTGAFDKWVVNLDPGLQALAALVLLYVVSYSQNWLEERGLVPTMLKANKSPETISMRDVRKAM